MSDNGDIVSPASKGRMITIMMTMMMMMTLIVTLTMNENENDNVSNNTQVILLKRQR